MMVDLQNLKNAITGGDFSEDVKQEAVTVIDTAIARGGEITVEEKQKLLNLIDLDMDRNELEQGANEEVAEMLESFIADVDSAAQTATDNIEASGEKPEEFQESEMAVPVQSEPVQPEGTPVEQPQAQVATPAETPVPETPQQ